MEPTLSARDRSIFAAVVEEFVQTAEPVGSRQLTKRYGLGVSPATVRNVMADLEDLGFLAQPHTSAGRQPTERGYRYYVDHLMQAEPVGPTERQQLRQRLGPPEGAGIEELLAATCQALSVLAHQVGIAVAPRFEARVFRHIDFVRLRGSLVLVVLVSQSGVVHHRPVEAPEVEDQRDLDQMANYLNGLLVGLPLSRVRERILAEMASERALYDRLVQSALELGQRALGGARGEEGLYCGDPTPLLDQPEFSTAARMKELFEAFEKKGLLLRLLDQAAAAHGTRVIIGEEQGGLGLRGCSVVSTTYGCQGRVLGSLGVIGPTRMPYPRMVGLVEYTGRLLGEMMDHL